MHWVKILLQIADKMFPTVTMCTQLRTLRTGSYMIVVPRPVVNDVTTRVNCYTIVNARPYQTSLENNNL